MHNTKSFSPELLEVITTYKENRTGMQESLAWLTYCFITYRDLDVFNVSDRERIAHHIKLIMDFDREIKAFEV